MQVLMDQLHLHDIYFVAYGRDQSYVQFLHIILQWEERGHIYYKRPAWLKFKNSKKLPDKGIELRTLTMVKRMLNAKIQIHQIMEVSGLTEAEIEKIQEEINL